MKKKREPLDLKGATEKKKPGARKGDVRNPGGKIPGTLTKSTNLGNEARVNLFQILQRSHGPQVLASLLNLRLPAQFVPEDVRERFAAGTQTAEDKRLVAQMTRTDYKWSMDFMKGLFPRAFGVFGTVQHEETVAGRTKRATKETKSPGMVEMVRKKMEDEAYEVDREEGDDE